MNPRRIAFVVALIMTVGSSATFASSGTTAGTGASGATYNLTVTCATRSATAKASLRTAVDFSSFAIVDELGHRDTRQFTINGLPATTGPQDWVTSAFLDQGGTTYRIDESSPAGVGTPAVGPVSTSDCPTYGGFGARFVAVTPKRILDTRSASAIGYTGPKPGASTSVEVQVAGTGGIPTGAVAVALNVTITEASQPGFAQVFPTGVGTPGASSNINAEATGQTIANSVIVPIGNSGRVTIFTSAGSHLLADVSGYFVNATAPVEQGRFVTVAPRRVLDTRAVSQINYSGPTPGAGATVLLNPVAAAGLPTGLVEAVAINLTATEAAAPGFVQVAPAGQLVPGANSNVNLGKTGQTIPNMVIVPVSRSGEIEIFTQSGTNLIVDVLGWFTSISAATSTSGLYFPVVPERVLDTRPDTAVNFAAERRAGTGETSKPGPARAVDIFFDGLPSNQLGAVILNVTATEATAAGFVQGAARSALVPGASSNVNVERAGQTIANAAILPVDQMRAVSIYTQNGTNLIADISGYFRR